jgi:RNA polymerase sigma-70 factor (ECF subfamily)
MLLNKPKYNEMTDEQLVIASAGGNKGAFDQLYLRYANMLLAYFMRMLWRDREKAEDFVQDFFTKLIHRPELFDASRSFKTWMFSVACNMCKNEYKRQEVRKNTKNGLDESHGISDHGQSPMANAHLQQFKQAYTLQLAKLEQKHQEVFELRHFEGLSIKEIAEVLNTNEGTVKSRLFYATKYLAEGLKEYQPETMKQS